MYVVGGAEGGAADEVELCTEFLLSFTAITSAVMGTAPPPSTPVTEVNTAIPWVLGRAMGSGGTDI